MDRHSIEDFLAHGHSHHHDDRSARDDEVEGGPFDDRPVPVIGKEIDPDGLWTKVEAGCAWRRSDHPDRADRAADEIASALEDAGLPVSMMECDVRVPAGDDLREGEWRPHRFPITNIVPEGGASYFILVGGQGSASLLELARLFELHRNELHHGVRFAWWNSGGVLGFEPAAWYGDANFDLLRSRCLAYMSVEQLAGRSRSRYEPCATAELADWVKYIIERVGAEEAKPTAPPEGADGSLLGVGLPSFSFLPVSRAQALDELDRDRAVERTAFHANALFDLCTTPRVPFRMMSVAEALWSELLHLDKEVGDVFNFGEIREAVKEFVVVLDDHMAKDEMMQPLDVNRKWMDICHLINPVLYTENGPFHRDVEGNRGKLPGLRRALQLKELGANSSGGKLLLRNLLQESNRICATMSQAILVARRDQ